MVWTTLKAPRSPRECQQGRPRALASRHLRGPAPIRLTVPPNVPMFFSSVQGPLHSPSTLDHNHPTDRQGVCPKIPRPTPHEMRTIPPLPHLSQFEGRRRTPPTPSVPPSIIIPPSPFLSPPSRAPQALRPLDDVALAIIGLAAGSELHLPVRPTPRSLASGGGARGPRAGQYRGKTAWVVATPFPRVRAVFLSIQSPAIRFPPRLSPASFRVWAWVPPPRS